MNSKMNKVMKVLANLFALLCAIAICTLTAGFILLIINLIIRVFMF